MSDVLTRLSDPATVRARDRTLNCTKISATNGVCSMEDTLSSTMPCGFILTRTSWTSASEDTAHAALGSAQIFRALTITAREVLRAILPGSSAPWLVGRGEHSCCSPGGP